MWNETFQRDFERENEEFWNKVNGQAKKDTLVFGGVATALITTAVGLGVAAVKEAKKNRKITKEEGVFKVRGKYYAYCPNCGKKCGHPQIIKGSGKLNTATFNCYTCKQKFSKQFDYTILGG